MKKAILEVDMNRRNNMKSLIALFALLGIVLFYSACVDNGTSSEALYSIEVGTSECSKDSIALVNLAAKMYQDGTCDLASVYSKMTYSCGARAREVYRNVSYAQLDSLLFASMATMEVQKSIKNVIDECDEFYLYAGGLYMFIERQDDGRGYK